MEQCETTTSRVFILSSSSEGVVGSNEMSPKFSGVQIFGPQSVALFGWVGLGRVALLEKKMSLGADLEMSKAKCHSKLAISSSCHCCDKAPEKKRDGKDLLELTLSELLSDDI